MYSTASRMAPMSLDSRHIRHANMKTDTVKAATSRTGTASKSVSRAPKPNISV